MNLQKTIFDIKTFKGLPSEVMTLICSFGYPEYKENMKEICHQITNYTGTGLLEYNMNLLHEDYIYLLRIRYVQCMYEFLSYGVDEEIMKDLFRQCTKCCCCSKHGHNRPTNYYNEEVSIGENFTNDCECVCRHIARQIKRVQLYPCSENYKKSKKCRRKSTFNIQFIPSNRRLDSS
uniref:Uncharacterized protein n=1 Tax=viral metagenome TaxID=1070528 RepID=A0A6C0D1W9_9ZZZZ